MSRFQHYWSSLSLASKIVGLVSLLVLATVLALTSLSIQRERENFRKELLEQANMLLDATSLNIRDQLYGLQIDEINDVARVVSKSPDVTQFVVYDGRGRVLADASGTRSIYSQTADPLGMRLLALDRDESYMEWQGDQDQLLVGRAVVLGNRAIGAVMTGLSTQPLDQKIRTITLQGIFLGFLTLMIAWTLTLLFARQITTPLTELADVASKMASGQFSIRVAEKSKDEIGRLAGAFNEMATGLQEREWLKDMFGRFVSQEVADAIRNGKIILEGENRVVSVLFCDIREFTDFSERHTPGEVVNLLNDYLPLVVQAAQKYGGMVNKFGGDSTLIIYGAPYEVKNNALKAVMTALEIRVAVDQLNTRLAATGESLRVGVGINTGVALAGAVGPMERQEYTVIGNTVNLAARIDGLNKQFPEHDILISAWTYEALGEYRSEFELVSLGEVPIRGKMEPIEIWAVRKKL
jgi:adenylate cyclase